MTVAATILDVLRNHLDQIESIDYGKLRAADLDTLAEAINAHYSSWSLPDVATEDFRVYSGGWIAGNTVVPLARQYLLTSLLYAPSVVIHEPLADWFDDNRTGVKGLPAIRGRSISFVSSEPDIRRNDGYFKHRDDLARTQAMLAATVPVLASLEPLIRDGTVVAVPQWQLLRKRQEPILAAVRADLRDDALAALIVQHGALPRSDQIRGMSVTPANAILASEQLRAAVQDPSYFFHKTAAIADFTNSLYVPPARPDAALREFKLKAAVAAIGRKDLDLQVVSALGATTLPFLTSVTAETVAAIRRDEEAFADWRAELRNIARTIQSLPGEGEAFAREAESALADSLLPQVHQIRRAVSVSTTMKAYTAPQALSFGIQAASLIGADAITGNQLDVTGLTALGLGTAASWLLAGHLRVGKPTNSRVNPRGVLATLLADWPSQT